ncbi:LPXTG cell wall anchor domain-containing protein [Demequina sp. NBRC 110054]|uniref:DUF7507 domain-containing protein n=1 Tax=Demequina sp. NBRC 110054 TaxID=1570343 RepID=UPI000A02CC83|nr:LPXTG cell wall anchor domain-containing protein [Demequina sp. NBRC 110054]
MVIEEVMLRNITSTRSRAHVVVLALVAAIVGAIAYAPVANAAAGSDDDVTVSYANVSIYNDVNGDGNLDVGDKYRVDITVTVAATAPGTVTYAEFHSNSTGFGLSAHVAPGESRTYTAVAPAVAKDVDVLGNFLLGGSTASTYEYQIDDGAEVVLAVESPSLTLVTEPLDVVAAVEYDEGGGSVADAAVQGDEVRYVFTVTNDSDAVIDIPASGTHSMVSGLAPGTSATLYGAWHTVTYADMEAGSIDLGDESIDWEAPGVDSMREATGTATVDTPLAVTEPFAQSFDADVDVVVHDQTTGAELTPGEIEAGDLIDYTYSMTNTGTVTLPAVGIGYNAVGSGVTVRYGANLVPGDSLPSGSVEAADLTSDGGNLDTYTISSSDMDRGWVTLTFYLGAAQTSPTLEAQFPEGGDDLRLMTETVVLRDLVTYGSMMVTPILQDTNGDGIGQAGEEVFYDYTVTNGEDSEQAITVGTLADGAGSDASILGGTSIGETLVAGDVASGSVTYELTAADEARGTLDYSAAVEVIGAIDGIPLQLSADAMTITTGAYVAPASSLDLDATYVDSNGDGTPSIGETATVTVTLANTGAYALTGIAVEDGTGADVTGLLPGFASTLAAGDSETHTYTHVITAEDYARLQVLFAAKATAEGLATPLEASATLTAVSFEAYESDLEGLAEGGIAVCTPDGEQVSEVAPGDALVVTPEGCDHAGSADGTHVVMMSTPVILSAGSYAVTVPSDADLGEHRIVLYAADGTVVGWQSLSVEAAVVDADDASDDAEGDQRVSGSDSTTDDALASTGADGAQLIALGAAALLVAGAAVLVVRRRRSRG